MKNLFRSRFITCLFAIFIAAFAAFAANTQPKEPDFAYPKKVESQANALLKKALKNGDGQAVVEALIQSGLAKTAIDRQEVDKVIGGIYEVIDNEKSPVTRSLLYTLLANIYAQTYESNRYVYDQRRIPLAPRSSHLDEWSGEQFKAAIDETLTEALKPAKALSKEPLAKYGRIIPADSLTRQYYPTLYDFTASQAIGLLQSITGYSTVPLNARWIGPASSFCLLPTQYIPRQNAKILDIFQRIIKANESNTAPRTMWDVRRIQYVAPNVVGDDGVDEANKSLFDLAESLRNTPYAGIPLAAMSSAISTEAEYFQTYFNRIAVFVAEYPSFFTTPVLRNCISQLEAYQVELKAPAITSPGFPTPVSLSVLNAEHVTIDVYLLPKTRSNNISSKDLANGTKIQSLPLSFSGFKPFVTDTIINVALPRYGEYAIVPVVDSKTKTDYISTVVATDLALNNLTGLGALQALVVNPVSGKPVSGAEITLTDRNSSRANRNLGKTNADGEFNVLASGAYGMAIATLGDDRYSPPQMFYKYTKPEAATDANILTDLPLYRPGGRVEVAIVAFNRRIEGNSPAKNRNLTIALCDVNNQQIGQTICLTDSMGRCATGFDLPTDGLTGYYYITVMDGDNFIASDRVMVSDYKMPQVVVVADEPSVDPGRPVVVKGAVTTYTGFPIEGADVNLSLTCRQPWFWGGGDKTPFYAVSVKTDAQGGYSFELPRELLDNSPIPDGIFEASITATSPSGESQSTSTHFVNRTTYQVKADCPANVDAASPIAINAMVTDSEGKPVGLALQAVLERDGETVAVIPLLAEKEIDLKPYPSGRYKMTINGVDSELPLTPYVSEFVLYRTNDLKSPVSELLWAPETNIVSGQKRMAKMYFEVSKPDTHVYYMALDSRGVAEKGWLNCHEGMNTLVVKVPENEKEIAVTIVAVRDLMSSTVDFKVNTPESLQKVNVEVATMRDHVFPGTPETITLTFKYSNGKPVKVAAVMLDIYNKALRALHPHDFRLRVWDLFSPSCHAGNGVGRFVQNGVHQSVAYVGLPFESMQPRFNFYDRSFAGFYGRSKGGMLRYTMAAPMKNSVPTSGLSMYDAGEPEAFVEMAMDDSALVDEKAVVVDGEKELPQTEWRDAETPLALFSPMLSADSNGNLTVSYTVPNANAAWVVSSLVYDQAMLNASLSREQIASKQIMVQPNAPRFLRMGDKAHIQSLVMNASSSTQRVEATFDIFDPATGATLASALRTYPLEPNGSITMSVMVDVPFNTTMLGYRIKAAAGDFSDAEQGLIPVLESITPVIESRNFYLPTDSVAINVPLPAQMPGQQVTLQYCQNPVWSVITALPGLSTGENRTATSAQAAIFSAAVADGILKNHPEVKSAIHRWLTSERSDSMLVSMLERNQDLKIALLEATPWMLDARSDTERMTRLALLFDKKETAEAISSNVALLAKLQNDDGGWSWTADYRESSLWVTMNALEGFGRLNKLGFMPNDKRLEPMIKKAVEYVDRTVGADFRRYPKGDYSHYVALRDLFPSIKQSSAASAVTKATVRRLAGDWKKLELVDKGVAALILNNHGYHATAEQILASLREYTTVTVANGMWWPSLNNLTSTRYSKLAAASIMLDAFAAIQPGSAAVDAIHQWIVLQKETQDWRTGVVTSNVIASLLATGTRWTVAPQGMAIKINGQDFTPTSVTATSGYFRQDITDLIQPGGGTLTVAKRGPYPSWGAVIDRKPMEMGAIRPAKCEGLSIQKNFYLNNDTTMSAAGQHLKVGDRVRVDLLIRVTKDLDYVAIIDQRGACFEPVEQLPAPIWQDGVCFYRENRDAVSNIFINRLPAGTYRLSYELYVAMPGMFSSGVATAQSQYAPQITAHSGGNVFVVD